MIVPDTHLCGSLWLIWSYLSNHISPTADQTTTFSSNISDFFSALSIHISWMITSTQWLYIYWFPFLTWIFLNSRLAYSTAYSTSPFVCLTTIWNVTCLTPNTWPFLTNLHLPVFPISVNSNSNLTVAQGKNLPLTTFLTQWGIFFPSLLFIYKPSITPP